MARDAPRLEESYGDVSRSLFSVVFDNRDPKGLARVRVRVSGLADTTGTRDLWARIATLMAGPNRGTWFLPEVGDEVLVAFERGDARVPYVVGAVWNGSARPPADALDPAANVTLIDRGAA